MRWLLLLVSVIAFGYAFRSTTPGMLALALLVAFGSLVGAFLGFAAARIGAQSQAQMSKAATLVAMSRGKATQQRGAAATAATTGAAAHTAWSPIDEGHHDHRGHHHHDHDAGDSAYTGGDSGGGSDGGGGGD